MLDSELPISSILEEMIRKVKRALAMAQFGLIIDVPVIVLQFELTLPFCQCQAFI